MAIPKYKDPDYHKKYYQKNKEVMNGRSKKHIQKYLGSKQVYRLYHSTLQRAKKQGLEFRITLEDIIIPEVCPYMGWAITNIYGCGRIRSNASIDRIDPSKGYVPGNIQVISDMANRMKQNANPEQLLMFAQGILKVHGTVLNKEANTAP